MLARHSYFIIPLVLCMSSPLAVQAQTRGYVSRACGFDLDHDGVVGEASGDCDKLCRGSSAATSIDLDGAGATDEQIFVDCVGGSDSNPGTAASAKKTIAAAMTTLGAPSATQIQAVCVRSPAGTCNQGDITISQSGATGTYTRDSFTFPQYPLMIVGWDYDGDGSYPPHDGDDTAVFEGNTPTAYGQAFGNGDRKSNVEVAHFTAQHYGLAACSGGFASLGGSGTGSYGQVYYHDLVLHEINDGCSGLTDSNAIAISGWAGDGLHNAAVVNVQVGYNAYFVRGASGAIGETSGPYRFQNITATLKALSGDTGVAIKLWGNTTGIEVLDSIFDADPDAWWSYGGWGPYALGIQQCTQGWTIRNNEVRDWSLGIQVETGDTFCDDRSIDGIVLDRNLFTQAFTGYNAYAGKGAMALSVGGGTSTTTTVEDLTITNNIFMATAGWAAVAWIHPGNPLGTNPGAVTVAQNTFNGVINQGTSYTWGVLTFGDITGAEYTYPQENIVVKNNIFSGLSSGQRNIHVDYDPTGWDADYNAYQNDPTGSRFVWNAGAATNFTTWKTNTESPNDTHSSVNCTPTFVSASDLHLASDDTCAKDTGTDAGVDYDYDGQSATGARDIGADEIMACHGQPGH